MTTALPKLEKLRPNPNWAKLPSFNRKNWTHLRFDDIVENVNERVEPSTAEEAIYVGLDDLDSGSLHSRLQEYRLGAKGGDWLADAMKREAK